MQQDDGRKIVEMSAAPQNVAPFVGLDELAVKVWGRSAIERCAVGTVVSVQSRRKRERDRPSRVHTSFRLERSGECKLNFNHVQQVPLL